MAVTIRRVVTHLNFQVLAAIVIGIVLGLVAPGTAKAMRPIGDTFVNLVKMVIAPIIFLTIVVGIATLGDIKRLGKVGGKALVYFEVVTTLALVIGIIVMNLTRPGDSLDISALPGGDVSKYAASAQKLTFVEYATHIVPSTVLSPFTEGDILQVVFVAILFGVALSALGDVGRPLLDLLDRLARVFFKIVGYVMVVAPLGAFGAMAHTVGNFGLKTLVPLARLMVDVYVTMAVFIFVVLGLIARLYRFRLVDYLRYIRDEILLVLGTSSSEVALPRLMVKLERMGCAKSVVGLVVPAGYSFNLDGTSIYLSMAVLFLVQVNHVPLSVGQQLSVLAVLMLTSKGAAGVTGSGFIVLASTLSAMQLVPVTSIAILLAVDRFMSEARAITNLIGNGVATIVIAKSENAFSEARYQTAIRGSPEAVPLDAAA